MSFANPNSLYLLLLIPLLLALYLMKLKRRTQIVSSCMLWDQVIEDMKANTLFQKLRKNLLLPLQIIFLVAIIFAIARPIIQKSTIVAQNSILIIDGSASMKSTDVGETRFQKAKQEAIKMVNELRGGGKMMIILAGPYPKIISGLTSDKISLKDSIDKLQAGDTTTDMGKVLRMALSYSRELKQSEIVILSDGAVNIDENIGSIDTPLRFIKFGSNNANNAGIINIEVNQEAPDTRSDLQVLVHLKNFSRLKRQSALLELYLNKKLIDVRQINIEPQERRSVIFDNIKYARGYIEAVLDLDDDLSVDNRAYYALNDLKPFRILMEGDGNTFLEKAIRSYSSEIEIHKGNDLKDDYDLAVYDGSLPASLPDKSMILINPGASLPYGKLLSQKNEPRVIDWDRSHPIMRFVDLSDLQIDSISNYEMPSWIKPVAETDRGILLWAGENNGRRVVIIPYDTRPGALNNFAMLSAFPIFIFNALEWIAETGKPDTQLKPGEVFSMYLKDQQQPKVRKPNGDEVNAKIKDNILVFGDTGEVGIYEFTDKSKAFAVNLLDEAESNIQPADRIDISGQEIASSAFTTSNREIWNIILVIAIIVLMAEWWVYNRRIFV